MNRGEVLARRGVADACGGTGRLRQEHERREQDPGRAAHDLRERAAARRLERQRRGGAQRGQLALEQVHDRIGQYRDRAADARRRDPSSAASGTPGQTTVNAQRRWLDRTTIGYIGEFNSGASAVSIPLLNRLGDPADQPHQHRRRADSSAAGAAPGEPEKYYPTGLRTFARVVPNDAVQASGAGLAAAEHGLQEDLRARRRRGRRRGHRVELRGRGASGQPARGGAQTV